MRNILLEPVSIWRFRHDLCDVASYGLVIAASISLAPIKVLTLKDICDPTLSRLYADDDVQKRHSTSFFTALSNMSSLESISLSFSKDPSDGDDPEPLSLIAEALKPLHLSSIKLQHVSGSPGSFVALLAQHESTLRRISFEDVGIVDRDPLWTWEQQRWAQSVQYSIRVQCH